MANRCASLDATWACLPGAAHPSWLSPVGAAFEDDALTAALWASMWPPVGAAAASSSSSSYCSASPTPSSSTTTTTSSARPGNGGPARAAWAGPTGRVSKRKPRPSRRAHTTYISADPADFRRMVQEITGYPVPGADAGTAFAAASSSTTAPWPSAAPACVLPTLDTSAFLLDSASPPPPQPKYNPTVISPTMAAFPAAVAVADEASSLLQELEAMYSRCADSYVLPCPLENHSSTRQHTLGAEGVKVHFLGWAGCTRPSDQASHHQQQQQCITMISPTGGDRVVQPHEAALTSAAPGAQHPVVVRWSLSPAMEYF
ncbi:hypothetical protein GUJ93_ZPchr0008g13246 [Zizania palustris]|uniref:VQ domain-containing protein n=1 Tax=Zizania palustris TaxID=103762 RepID=A0A8J5REK8_ZIZPA|nr:hypothetical protein GUJ93_ZPchr0008g13246 [Zizania palustris]